MGPVRELADTATAAGVVDETRANGHITGATPLGRCDLEGQHLTGDLVDATCSFTNLVRRRSKACSRSHFEREGDEMPVASMTSTASERTGEVGHDRIRRRLQIVEYDGTEAAPSPSWRASIGQNPSVWLEAAQQG